MMATKSQSDRRYHEIVEALAPDPSRVTHLQTHVGMLGRSTRDTHSRLYLTIDLCDYLEIADEDIVHTVPMNTRSSPLGAAVNIVWLKPEAKFTRFRLQTQDEARDDSDGFTRIPLQLASQRNSDCKYLVDKVHL